MRLYPPVPFMSRAAIARRPHRQPQDPDAARSSRSRPRSCTATAALGGARRLHPERFLPERRGAIDRFAYLPFGAGPRVCIGASLLAAGGGDRARERCAGGAARSRGRARGHAAAPGHAAAGRRPADARLAAWRVSLRRPAQLFFRNASRLTTSALPPASRPRCRLLGASRLLGLCRLLASAAASRASFGRSRSSPGPATIGFFGAVRRGSEAAPRRRARAAPSASLTSARRRPELELEAELDGGVEEAGQRVEGHEQPLRHAGEGQPDLEGVLRDAEIPELVLQDDRHVLRVFLAQPLRHAHAREIRAERDVEMMVAGQAVPGGVGETLRTTPLRASCTRRS